MNQSPVKYLFNLQLFFLLSFMIFGCLPAKTKIALPDYDRVKPIEPVEQGDIAAQEEQSPKVPGVLLETHSLERDDKYQKNAGGELAPEPVSEEDLTVVGGGQNAIPLPDPGYIAYRLTEYAKALKEWNQMAEKLVALDAGAEWPARWHDCVQGLEYMVFGYKRVADILDQEKSTKAIMWGGNPWDIIQRDVHYLESGCPDVFKKSSEALEHFVSEYKSSNIDALQSLLQHLTLQGDYRGVVSSYEGSIALLQDERVGFSVHSYYAHALVHEGRVEDSLAFMARKLRDEGVMEGSFLDDSQEVWRAVLEYADLLLTQGHASQAKEIYLQLDTLFVAVERDSEWVAGQLNFLNDYTGSPEKYGAFVKLLQEYLHYDGRGIPQPFRQHYQQILSDYDDLGLHSNARRVMRKAEERARQWAQKKLREVDYLAHEKEFQNAKTILDALTNLPSDLDNEVVKMKATVSRLESEAARGLRRLQEEELARQWDAALLLFEAGEYEEAIEAFSFFVGSKYKHKAAKKRLEAVDKLTIGLRREAADLFAGAMNMKDFSGKMDQLQRSQEILEHILKSYPEAEIGPKVEQNLQALENQIRLLESRPSESLR